MNNPRRLFFALRPDAQVVTEIQAVQKMIPPGRGRAVPMERMHATLLFLGNQDEERLDDILGAAATVKLTGCRVRLDRCGSFPRAGVVWLGPSQVPRALESFQQRLVTAVSDAGIRFDSRPWKMHVTLYRNLRMRPETITFEPVNWTIRGFELMESISGPNGLKYVCRGRWPV